MILAIPAAKPGARFLLQDRQTGVGVGLAETVDAKNALHNAGAKLADRIVGAPAAVK